MNHSRYPVPAERYPEEDLTQGQYAEDNGTMTENVDALRQAVVGHRIVKAEQRTGRVKDGHYWNSDPFVLTLDDGTEVMLFDTNDCCAYTELQAFLLNPALIDHVIMGVGTTGGYQTWHIYADLGDVLEMTVGWSSGNPFYYGYGFDIRVVPVTK